MGYKATPRGERARLLRLVPQERDPASAWVNMLLKHIDDLELEVDIQNAEQRILLSQLREAKAELHLAQKRNQEGRVS